MKDTILRMKADLWLNETQSNVERAFKAFYLDLLSL